MKCFFSIRIVLLAMIMLLPGVAVCNITQDSIEKCSFTLNLTYNHQDTMLNCEAVNDFGYLRNPNNYDKPNDRRYYIFLPHQKYNYIELSTSSDNVKVIVEVAPYLQYVLHNSHFSAKTDADKIDRIGAWQANSASVVRPKAWYELPKDVNTNGFEFEITSPIKYGFFVVPCDLLDFSKVAVEIIGKNNIDTVFSNENIIVDLDEIGYGTDTTVTIKVTRPVRSEITSVKLNGKDLPTTYYLKGDATPRKKDDIAHENSTAEVKLKATDIAEKDSSVVDVTFMYFDKDGKFVTTKKSITILNPKEDKAAGGWLSGIIDNPWIVVIVVLIVAFIVCLMIALKGRYYVKLGIKKDTDELKNKYKKFKLKKSKAQIEETFDNLEKFEIVFRKRELNFKKLKDVKKTVESTVASLEKDQLESLGCEKVMVSIEINNDDIRCKVGDKYEKVRKVGLNDEVAPQMDKIGASDDSQKVQTESTESDSKTESNSETSEVEQPNSAAEQVFKCVSDHEIAEKLLDVFKKEFDKGETWRSDEIDDKLKKLGIRAVCNKWNKGHEEKEQVPVSDFSIEGLFKAIGKGYIGTKAKDEMDYYKKEEHKTYSDVLVSIATEFENKGYEEGVSETEARKNNEIAAKDEVIIAKDGEIRNLNEAIEGLKLEKGKEQKAFAEEKAKLERKAEDVLNALKELLQTLANNKFEVGSCESEDAIVIIGAIKESIEKGVNGDEQKVQIEQLKTENNNLQTELDAEKQKVQDTESAAAQKLKEQQDGYEAHIQNLKNEHQKALTDKEIEKNNAVSAKVQELNTAHQENVTKLNAEHGEEISRLKADHEEEIGILREEHSNNVTALESKHAQELKNKEDSYNTLLKDKDAAHGREVKQLNDDHEKVVVQKDAEITSLNATIQEKDGVISQKDAEAHLDCASYVEQIMRAFDNIRLMIDRLCVSTSNAANNLSINAMNKVQTGFERFVTKAKQSHEEQWQLASCRMSQVIAELQECIKPGLKESGWVNIISYLNLYAGASKELNDLFKERGLMPTELSRLYAEIQSFIGMFGVKVVVPNLLADTFDEASFEFANADQWISVFAPSMRPRDYETRIFDMSCIGYQIDGGEYVKPKVYFN